MRVVRSPFIPASWQAAARAALINPPNLRQQSGMRTIRTMCGLMGYVYRHGSGWETGD
jgi:hypothetical protein